MMRRWWGGTGLSVLFHAALLIGLIYAAARPPRIIATPSGTFQRPKFIFTVTPGLPGAGGGDEAAAAPRAARSGRSAPVQTVAPRAITNLEPLPAAVVPVISEQSVVDVLPGAPMPMDGATIGKGTGPGAGGGRGPGFGPGAGPGAGDVYTAGVGGVSNPALIYEVKPNYTVDAMRAKIQGVIVLEVTVLADGTVDPRQIRITRSLGAGLDREAAIAVRQWRFRPSMLLGHPVASRVLVELAFTLR